MITHKETRRLLRWKIVMFILTCYYFGYFAITCSVWVLIGAAFFIAYSVVVNIMLNTSIEIIEKLTEIVESHKTNHDDESSNK